jgi:hypothetical protein
MLRGTVRVVAATAVAACIGCGGLAHPQSDDGNDKGNPTGINPGQQTLIVNIAKTTLNIGDTISFVPTFNGAALTNNGSVATGNSDTTVVRVGGFLITARALGSATISVSYGSYAASPPLGITVVAR